ncbi:MAG: TetR/AcrR family transcriptional regulator, partial [Myxococcota bacterium]
MTWQRARTPKQKAKREQEILDAAAELFLRESYSDITLVKIAQVAGFTRSNVYRYFATKEDIFLQLYQDDLEAFFTHLAQELNALDVPASSAAISDTCATVIMEHPLLLALLPLVTSVLEVNSSEEKLLQLKLELKNHAVGFYEALER